MCQLQKQLITWKSDCIFKNAHKSKNSQAEMSGGGGVGRKMPMNLTRGGGLGRGGGAPRIFQVPVIGQKPDNFSSKEHPISDQDINPFFWKLFFFFWGGGELFSSICDYFPGMISCASVNLLYRKESFFAPLKVQCRPHHISCYTFGNINIIFTLTIYILC